MSPNSGIDGLDFDFFIPAKVDHIESGVGSFLNLFLAGHLPTREGGLGSTCKIQIWVYLCDWVLYEGDREVLNSDVVGSPEQSFPLSSFDGTTMTGLRFHEGSSCVVFDFDQNLRLKLTPDVESYGEEEDLFRVYLDGGILYSFSWAQKFQWDTPPKEH